ncbi:hypothetical protein KKI22_00615 [Patescibacteria group bacterium]|nr:hypothetical protein [Patescibacteria group bacterium]
MKKINYLFILFAVAFSVFILLISLQSANKARMTNEGRLVSGKFYIAKEILPDHSLYPILMVVDRLRLELAGPERRVYLLSSYANRRLFYSKKLLEKNDQALALTTLSKAIKYINQALEENIGLIEKASPSKTEEYQKLAFFTLENFNQDTSFTVEYKSQFNDEGQAILDALSTEGLSLAEKLRSLMNQSIQN